MVKKCVFSTLFMVALLTFISGCSFFSPKFFVDPSLTGEKVTAGGIAVFPVILGQSVIIAGGIESYCRDAGEEMTARIKKRQPAIRILSPADVSSILNKENLVPDYSKMAEDYQKTGILNTVIAKKLAEALGVKYFIINRLISLYREEKSAVAILNTQVWSAEESHLVFECNKKEANSGFFSPPYDKAVKYVTLSSTATLTSVLWKK